MSQGKRMKSCCPAKGRLHRIGRIAASIGLIALAAGCGGGGGGGEPASTPIGALPAPGPAPATPPGPAPAPAPAPSPAPSPTPAPAPVPAANFTLAGTIRTSDVFAVDSDTNDPNQLDYRINDDPSQAQAITSPITVVGSVNLVLEGPPFGTNFRVGDAEDWYRVTLRAGQVVELIVGLSSGALNDADLCVVGSNAQSAACSVSTTERECVRATADGEYFVLVNEFSTSSVYNLRISAPGAGVPCTTDVTPLSAMVQGQLLAVHREAAAPPAGMSVAGSAHASQAQPLARAALLSRLSAAGAPASEATPQGLPVDVVNLPPTGHGREVLLTSLQYRGATATNRERLQIRSASEATTQDAARSTLLQWRIAKALQASGAYAAVEPNWILHHSAALVGAFPPADARYTSQRWHYEQINLPSAMQALLSLTPQPTVRPVIAVIDDGVMLDHPDVAGQLIDRGRRFVSSAQQVGGLDRADAESTATSSTDSFHGTHVAATALAATFDGGPTSFGAGVAPMAQLLPLNVFGPQGGASTLDVAEAIRYAAGLPNRSSTLPLRRADVINLSLGSQQSCSATAQSAINAARAAGVLIVAAAGNDSRNDRGRRVAVGQPANCAGVFAVGATDALRGQAFYSNSGSTLSLAAPGGDMGQRTNGSGSADGVYSAWGVFQGSERRPSFTGLQGTSMASPHAAGVMALMRWVHPTLTPDQVSGFLQNGQLTDELGAQGRDDLFGWGLINARKAVDAAVAARSGVAPPPVLTPITASPSTLDFGATASRLTLRLAPSGTSSERVLDVTSDSPAVTVAAAAVDANGHGDYLVSVDRSRLPASTASYFPRLLVQVSPTRRFTVQVAFVVAGAQASALGNVGPVYVLVYNPATDRTIETRATFQAGTYRWRLSNYSGRQAIVIAGTDLDANDFVCEAGEVCGGFPILSTDAAMTMDLTGDRLDLDFVVSPVTDSSLDSLGGRSSPPLWAAGPASRAAKRPDRTPALRPLPPR